MNIENIKHKVELLMMANNHRYVLIPELGKELKVSKTDLTEYVLTNPKLFYCENIWSYKDVKVKRRMWPGDTKTYTSTEQVRSRNLGMGIKTVYLQAEDNFRTDEWLQKQIIDRAKYFSIAWFDNYGQIEGYFISLDKKPGEISADSKREWLWRNTPEKINYIVDRFKLNPASAVMGGFGDSYTSKPADSWGIYGKVIDTLESEGWTHNALKSLERYAQ